MKLLGQLCASKSFVPHLLERGILDAIKLCLEEVDTKDWDVLMTLKRDASFALSNIAADKHPKVLDYLI